MIVIVVEVDEHQHQRKGYSCECEITRMKQIYLDWSIEQGRMLFIRYNPDSYESSYGKELTTRLIRHVPEVPEPGLKVLYLFYDGFSPLSEDMEHINPYVRN